MYMSRKFSSPEIKKLFEKWTTISSAEDFNKVRYQLERCRVVGGKIVPKGGKAGAPYTARQLRSYVREYKGKTYLGVGVLAKLASRTWDAKKHKDRIGVLKAMAGMKQSDCFENKVPNPDWMEDALKEKFQHEPFRSLLLETERERIAEADDLKVRGQTATGT